MQSDRSQAFLAFIQMPGHTSVEPVYRQGIGLAAIAARSAFGTKAGAVMILPLPLTMVMISEWGVMPGEQMWRLQVPVD